MNFRPLGARVLVAREEAATMTSSGLHIPVVAQDKLNEGRVKAVGPEVSHLAVDDLVVFGKYSGDIITLDGVDHVILEEDKVWGVKDA